MATTTHDRTTDGERPAGAPPAPERRRKGFGETFRDMYIERKDGPVTMRERWRAALSDLIGIPLFIGVVAAVQIWGRDREVEPTWFAAGAGVTVLFAAIGFAFPRFSIGGNAMLRNTDWSKESTASKVLAVVAMVVLIALVVGRAVARMD